MKIGLKQKIIVPFLLITILNLLVGFGLCSVRHSSTKTYTVIFVIFAFALAWGLALYVWRTFLNPIKLLKKGFAKVGAGELQFRLPAGRTDEFGNLQEGFNLMAAAIESRDNELLEARIDLENLAFKIQNYSEDLEREVAERTRELHKAYEDMKENDRLKSEFIANMSHELRTPLNSIIGFSKVILKGIDGPINERQQQDLTLIHKSGQHLLNLIAHILDFSKLEAGSFDLQKATVDLEEVAHEAIMSVHPLVKDKPVHVEMEVASMLPRIEADRMRILQVMINLLGNAAKFTERGLIKLDIVHWTPTHKTAPREDLVVFDNGVLITVVDTGIGIPEESRDIVFEKFQQVDGSSTRAYGGTGLGLAITRELVVLHGGHIWFDSIPDKGTTFYVLLPINEN